MADKQHKEAIEKIENETIEWLNKEYKEKYKMVKKTKTNYK
jgi:hypothetical protein